MSSLVSNIPSFGRVDWNWCNRCEYKDGKIEELKSQVETLQTENTELEEKLRNIPSSRRGRALLGAINVLEKCGKGYQQCHICPDFECDDNMRSK